ncbi:conserved repeat domain protein [Methanosalsum zhilinae DSM 4017]|uniref:Conserved repeat domain protein n=1 Tax=Methanosalsum zhilinae (strain DSM 4017 / NBRC 107636 / OCM 62 / WeN5) TaxID=679901 RepID=F7XK80_METZD|nr:hypothetical protein [Methanosalsum zhilinae]AEH60545.1 conserved repeat domain protein [Methanosalsum zhilinae DSM 4017]
MFKKISYLLIFLFAIGVFLSPATASSDVEWTSSIDSKKLYWGDSVEHKDYTVRAQDFNKDGYVHISIYMDGQLKTEAPLRVGDSIEHGDEIRVYVKEVKTNIDSWSGEMKDPYADVQIFRRGLPELEINIKPDRDTYDPKKASESSITATVVVKNTGNAKAEDVRLALDIDGLELIEGDLDHSFTEILKGKSSDPVTIKMKTPHIWDSQTFNLHARATGFDIKGQTYDKETKKSVTVEKKWDLKVTKLVTGDIYIDEVAHATVMLRNSGLVDINSIEVSDSIHNNFIPEKDVSLNKTLSLKPGESITLFKYSMTPKKPGKYNLPQVKTSFTSPENKKYQVSSDKPEVKVNGPYIILNKEANPSKSLISEEITITLKINNIGNVDASVNVYDHVPENSTLISGDTKFSDVVKKDSSTSFNYRIKMDQAGEMELPPAESSYVDMSGYRSVTESNRPLINIYSEGMPDSAANVQEDANNRNNKESLDQDGTSSSEDEKVQPGFEILISIISLAAIYVMFCKKDGI